MIGRVMVEGLLQNAEELQAAVHAGAFAPQVDASFLFNAAGVKKKQTHCDHDTIVA